MVTHHFCLLVLRLTLRIQTQSRSVEERESQDLYRQGCEGGRQKTVESSCIVTGGRELEFRGGKKREVPNTAYYCIQSYTYHIVLYFYINPLQVQR